MSGYIQQTPAPLTVELPKPLEKVTLHVSLPRELCPKHVRDRLPEGATHAHWRIHE